MGKRRGIRVDGQLLRKLRHERGWSQDEAATRAGVSTKLFRKAEQGQPLDAESIVLLAALFSTAARVVTPQDLVTKDSHEFQFAQADPSHSALLEEWFKGVWGEGDWTTLQRLTSPTIQFHCRLGLLITRKQLQDEIASIRESFSDFETHLESQTRIGSLHVGRWQMRMRHTGDWLGQAPTGEWLEFVGTTTLRVESNCIVEGWEYWHPLPTYLQLRQGNSAEALISQGQSQEVSSGFSQSIGRRPRSFLLRGDILRDFRQQQAWTQLQASQAFGVSERLLRKAESGGPVDASSVAMLARGFVEAGRRIPPEYLLADPRQLKFLSPTAFDLGARVQRWFDAQWNHPNFDVIDELATPDFVYHSEVGVIRGPAELKERVREFSKSFSDFNMVAEEVCDLGDALAVRWSCTMIHSGPWLDLPPTGRKILLRGSSWAQLVGEKFGDAWDFWDPATVYAQLVGPSS